MEKEEGRKGRKHKIKIQTRIESKAQEGNSSAPLTIMSNM
jgi:hypothetical protein